MNSNFNYKSTSTCKARLSVKNLAMPLFALLIVFSMCFGLSNMVSNKASAALTNVKTNDILITDTDTVKVWDFTKTNHENDFKTNSHLYFTEGKHIDGITLYSSGDDFSNKKYIEFKASANPRMFIPVGQGGSGTITVQENQKKDKAFVTLELGGNYSNPANPVVGTPVSTERFGDPRTLITDKNNSSGRPANTFDFTAGDLTYVGGDFDNWYLVLCNAGALVYRMEVITLSNLAFEPSGSTEYKSLQYVDGTPVGGTDAGNVEVGSTVTIGADPTTEGFKFFGWAGFGEEILFEGDTFVMPDGDVTLTAQWKAFFVVMFVTDGQGSLAGIDNIDVLAETGSFNLPAGEGVFVPSGYQFIGWTIDNQQILNVGESVTIDESTNVCAVYAKLEFSGISFRTGDNPGIRFGFYIDFLNVDALDESDLSGNFITETLSKGQVTHTINNFGCVNGQYIKVQDAGSGTERGERFNLVIVNFDPSFGSIDIAVGAEVVIFGTTLTVSSNTFKIADIAAIAYLDGQLSDAEAAMYGYAD